MLHNKTAKVLIAVFVTAIIMSFVLSTDSSIQKLSGHDVAEVNGMKITGAEFQRSYNQQLQFYKQFFKDLDMSDEQLKEIQKASLNRLIQSKLLVSLGKDISLEPSTKLVADKIKELDYFKTAGQFDVAKYQELLKLNRLNPQKFEQEIADSITVENVNQFLDSKFVSQAYENEMSALKNTGIEVNYVKVSRDDLKKFVTVSNEEITNFISKKENNSILENDYKQNAMEYNKPEKIKASHILLKSDKNNDAQVLAKITKLKSEITIANFAKKANEFTEDPSGKTNGGSLSEFSRGAMVPEFEKVAFELKENTISAPVKTQYGYHLILLQKKTPAVTIPFEIAKTAIAKKIIQKSKDSEATALYDQIVKNIKTYMETKNNSSLELMAKQYDLKFQQNQPLNIYDNKIGNDIFSAKTIMAIYKEKNTTKTYEDSSADGSIGLAQVSAISTPKEVTPVAQNNTLVKEAVLETLQKNAKIKTNVNF